MDRKYTFSHMSDDGNDTRLLTTRDRTFPNDKLAEWEAIQHARRMYESGLKKGYVRVRGYWGAMGYEYTVPMKTAHKIRHPFDEISTTELPGFNAIANTIEKLWPWEGEKPVKTSSLEFNVWSGKVECSIARPMSVLVEMKYKGINIMCEHGGPSIVYLVTYWNVTVDEAHLIWGEVRKKVAALEVLNLK